MRRAITLECGATVSYDGKTIRSMYEEVSATPRMVIRALKTLRKRRGVTPQPCDLPGCPGHYKSAAVHIGGQSFYFSSENSDKKLLQMIQKAEEFL